MAVHVNVNLNVVDTRTYFMEDDHDGNSAGSGPVGDCWIDRMIE